MSNQAQARKIEYEGAARLLCRGCAHGCCVCLAACVSMFVTAALIAGCVLWFDDRDPRLGKTLFIAAVAIIGSCVALAVGAACLCGCFLTTPHARGVAPLEAAVIVTVPEASGAS